MVGHHHTRAQNSSTEYHLSGLHQWYYRGLGGLQMAEYLGALQVMIPISAAIGQFYLLTSAHQKRGAAQSQIRAGFNMVSSHLDLECVGEVVCLLGYLHHSHCKSALHKITNGCRSKTKLTYLSASHGILTPHPGEVVKVMVGNHLAHQSCDCGLHVSVP